jgi:YhcH/YjgK/YiaL family protein
MIIDQIKNISKYKILSDNFAQAFSFIKETDLGSLIPGKYIIQEEKIFALISEYETKDPQEINWEAHKKYIDIQIMIEGEERMGFNWIDYLTLVKEYNSEKDIMFFEGEGEYVTLKKGHFIILFPYDAHKPGQLIDRKMNVKKIVIKVMYE